MVGAGLAMLASLDETTSRDRKKQIRRAPRFHGAPFVVDAVDNAP
jgi:hypothetical protein